MATRVDLGNVKGPKGDAFTYDDFTAEQLEDLHSGITNYYKELKSTFVTTEDNTTTIPINISEYRDGIDILSVFVNGLNAKETIDYTKSGNNIVLTNGVIKGTKIHFVVLRSVAATTEDYDLLKGDPGTISDEVIQQIIAEATAAAKEAALKAENPVGKIRLETTNTNPATYLGFGTWTLWGAGRVPVGVDTSQTEFNTVEKTGGEKTHKLTINEMASHYHENDKGEGEGSASEQSWGYSRTNTSNMGTATTSSVGGDQPHNNLQPYITCYMWKRTA